MSKLWLVRFITIGTPTQAFDCWFRTEDAALKVYEAACQARRGDGRSAAPHGAFLPHEITDDFGVRQSINLLSSTIIFTDTEKSVFLSASVDVANKAAVTALNQTQAAAHAPYFRPQGSTQ